MSDDRIWIKAEPLTPEEKASRLCPSTIIRIETSSERIIIRRNWERGFTGDGTEYGYAETRGTERLNESQFELKVPMVLNFPLLAQVILAEIQRQQRPLIEQAGLELRAPLMVETR